MKRNLILDFDDTLVHLVRPRLKWLRTRGITDKIYHPEDVHSYDWFKVKFGDKASDFFLKNSNQTYETHDSHIPGSITFLKWAEKYFNLKIVTHVSNNHVLQAKTNFIKKVYEENNKINIHVEFFEELNDKYKYIDGILIDDYPRHIINHISYNKQPAILFDYQGKNGWSKIKDYGYLTDELQPNLKYYSYATTYEQIKNILKEYI